MVQPLVTVGLTSYNAIKTIDRALTSALHQNWRPIEIVCVDDASTDGTADYLQRIAGHIPEVRAYYNTVNSGVAASRNRILQEAKGEFVVFFDDDDQSLPDRISIQFARIADYENSFAGGQPVICHTARELIYPDGQHRIEPTMGMRPGCRAPAGLEVARRILVGAPLDDGYGACPTCSQMARLSTYRLINGFDPALRRSEDTDFNIRLSEAGGHFVGVQQPLVIQTMTKSTEKSVADEYRYLRQVLEKHRALIGRDDHFRFALSWLNAKQAWLEKRHSQFFYVFALLLLSHPVLASYRLWLALPNVGLNRAFSRFHAIGRRSLAT